MSRPAAGKRTALGRLADALRRRLMPDRGAPPATVPGLGSGEETALAAAAAARAEPVAAQAEPEPTVEPPANDPPDAGARIDAARERLRARIDPPDPDAD